MPDIVVPKLNTVDTAYVLVEWLHEDGARVPDGAPVAVVETSKTAEELVCDQGGILHRLVEPPAECELGAVIGRLFADEAERAAATAADGAEHATALGPTSVDTAPADGADAAGPAGAGLSDLAGITVTRAAAELIARHGISPDRIRALGRSVVRGADVEQLLDGAVRVANGTVGALAPAPAGPIAGAPADSGVLIHDPGRAQRAVARSVDVSHRTIPAAACTIRMDVGGALDVLADAMTPDGVPVGLAELAIRCVAARYAEFPLFFARLREDGTAAVPGAPRIGVTVDVGTGLSVPVLRGAEHATLAELAQDLAGLRFRALRGQLREADLADGGISLALNDDEGIVAAQPIILPPQVCILSLCSVQQDLRLGAAGAVTTRRYADLTLTYDHRLLNGREAALFLRAVRADMEDPRRVERYRGPTTTKGPDDGH